MLKGRWNDTKVQGKADKAGLGENHKYRDRKRSIEVKENFIKRYLKDYAAMGNFKVLDVSTADKVKVLDVSTGNGVFVELMNDLGHVATGTEIPDSPYIPFHKSQKISVVYCDSTKTLPFKKGSFDLVTCIGGFNEYPADSWSKILANLFKIATETVLISIAESKDYNKNKEVFDNIPDGWHLTDLRGTTYRWDKD